MRRIKWPFLVLLALSFSVASGVAHAATVHVRFAVGATEISPLNDEVPFYTNHKGHAANIPAEMAGLSFTHRHDGIKCNATVSADGDTTVYVIVESEDSKHNPNAIVQTLINGGWVRLDAPDGFGVVKGLPLAAFRRSISAQQIITLDQPGPSGFFIAAKALVIDSATTGGGSKENTPPSKASVQDKFHPDPPLSEKALPGPTTKVTQMQTAIDILVVNHLPGDVLVGKTIHTVLTVLRGDTPAEVNFRFISNVGPEMRSARDDAVRYVHVRYPNWTASGAELTFAERDGNYEGGSIGAALSTLLLSSIQGFMIDHNVAVTGDVSADGTLLKIGGVYAKVHGAEAANCTLVVIPTDNFGELLNTEAFIGKGEVPEVQVIGAETIDDVIAAVRIDRDKKLNEAIELYDQVQQNISSSKSYLHSPECAEKLTQILSLCPRHFSAKLLLMAATGKRPKTLSAGASRYYISVAVDQMMPVLLERAKENSKTLPSSVVHQGLDDLEKLRVICDPNLLPLIDAWERFIRTLSSIESGLASPQNLEAQRQAVIDAAAKVDMNADLMQKMLKEGI